MELRLLAAVTGPACGERAGELRGWTGLKFRVLKLNSPLSCVFECKVAP